MANRAEQPISPTNHGEGHPERSKESAPAPPEHAAYSADLYCPDCGYNLRGLTSDRCPECGLVLDFIESDTPIIPWERRHELGPFRAYWQTVRMVILRNKVFCRAAYRSVSHRDAQLFRWITIAHAFVPLILAMFVELTELADSWGGWRWVALGAVSALIALLAATGLPSYLFHPRFLTTEQQNRAIALSYYGCAALALLPAVLVAAALVAIVGETRSVLDLILQLLVFIAFASAWAVSWGSLINIAQRTLRRPGAVAKVAVLVPVLWLIGGGSAIVGLPLVVYFITLVIYSVK